MAIGNSCRGTGEETEKIQICIVNEMLDLSDERRELKGRVTHTTKQGAGGPTDITQRGQEEDEINQR